MSGLEPTDELYHYTTAPLAVDVILPQMQVRLGLFESMNDPRESRPTFPPLTTIDEVSSEHSSRICQHADSLLRRSAKAVCFTQDFRLPEEVLDPDALRGYAHPAMWAHYGGGHSGVCLRFSRSVLSDRLREELSTTGQVFEGPVEYGFHFDTYLEPLPVEQIDLFGLDAVVHRYIQAPSGSARLGQGRQRQRLSTDFPT